MDKARGDEFRAVIADIRLKQSEIDLAEEELEGTRRVFQTANDKARGFPDLAGQLETMGEQDLIELEADFINHAEHGPQFRKLLMLVEEWRQRFGQSDRKRVVEGKSVSVRVDLGGRRIIKKK